MQVLDAFRFESKEVVAFVGGGGKTTAMFRLADELVAHNKRVITTTTTRFFAHQVAGHGNLVLRYDGSPELVARALAALQTNAHVTIVGEDVEGDKVAGIPPALVDRLADLDPVDAVLVEADGARMRPLKAPAEHEPVLPIKTTLLVPVVGVTAIGAPLDEEHVHRPEVVARLAGAQLGGEITPSIVARVLTHPEGGLKGRPSGARVIALVNQVETEAQLETAHTLANLTLDHPEISAVAIGAAQDESRPIREVRRRVAAIVLAAGAGTRMGERIKQLLPWRGTTLLQNALDVANQSLVAGRVLVLGSRAETISAAIGPISARVVVNPDWEQGHSTSIRAGIRALSPQVDAAVFVNADQPLLPSRVVDQVIQRYYSTGARIVVPFYAGKRGSPVLFDRAHFSELQNLQGEQGGRELLAKYPFERVDFADDAAAFDVDTPEDYEAIRDA